MEKIMGRTHNLKIVVDNPSHAESPEMPKAGKRTATSLRGICLTLDEQEGKVKDFQARMSLLTESFLSLERTCEKFLECQQQIKTGRLLAKAKRLRLMAESWVECSDR